MADGISLLLLRPQLLMSSLQQLIILTAMRLSGVDVDEVEPVYPSLDVDGVNEKDREEIADSAEAVRELCGEMALDNEIFDKIRGLESKLEYQIKKLVGLADASANAAANAEAAVEEGTPIFILLTLECPVRILINRPVVLPTKPRSYCLCPPDRDSHHQKRRGHRGIPSASARCGTLRARQGEAHTGAPCACSLIGIRNDHGRCAAGGIHIWPVNTARRPSFQLYLGQARRRAAAHGPVRRGQHDASRHYQARSQATAGGRRGAGIGLWCGRIWQESGASAERVGGRVGGCAWRSWFERCLGRSQGHEAK